MKKVEGVLSWYLHFFWEIRGTAVCSSEPRGVGWETLNRRGMIQQSWKGTARWRWHFSSLSLCCCDTFFSPSYLLGIQGGQRDGWNDAWLESAGHLWQKAARLRKLGWLVKQSFMGLGWRGKELNWEGEGCLREIKRSQCCRSWGLRAIYVCVHTHTSH